MKETNQSVTEPEENGVEESTKGFPVVTDEQDGDNAILFEMKKRNKAGGWDTVSPVSTTSLEYSTEKLADEPEYSTEKLSEEPECSTEEPTEELEYTTEELTAEPEYSTEELTDEQLEMSIKPENDQPDEAAAAAAIAAAALTADSAVQDASEATTAELTAPESEPAPGETEELSNPESSTAPGETEELTERESAPGETEKLSDSEAGESASDEAEKSGWEAVPSETTEPVEVDNRAADEQGAEPAETEEKPRITGKRIAAIIAGVAAIAVVAFSAFVYLYPNIFPGVHIADDYKLGGMSQEEAQEYIAGDVFEGIKSEELYLSGTDLLTEEEKYYAFPISEIAESVDSSTAAQQAYLIGREGNYFQRVGTVLNSMFTGWEVTLNTQLKDGAVEAHVDSLAASLAYDPIQPSWSIDKETETMTIDTGTQGVGFDKEKVSEELTSQLSQADLDPYTIETYLVDQNKPDPEKIAEESSTEPINATVDKTDGTTIIDSVDGIQIDPSSIATAIGDATEQTYTIPVEYTPATITGEDLSQVLFRDTLASTTTYYNSGQTGRTTNLRLATEAINGTILNPGEEFSYNDIVGERTAARGYKTAIIFTDGQQVNDYGGGVCQPSSTTYMAVLRADLEVTERWCHQFQVTYTPISQDAAVAWGSKDFRFKNNTDYPIKIVASASGGSLTVQILGTKTVDKEVSFSTSTSYGSSYKYAALYKTVTVNGESTTVQENSSTYKYG